MSIVAIMALVGLMLMAQLAQGGVSVSDSLLTEVPGRIPLVAWGWHGPLSYQVVPRTGYDLAYFKKHIVDESWKWGANLLELYPPNYFPFGYPMPWDVEDPEFVKPQLYRFWRDPRWTEENLRELTRHCHQRGLLAQWFILPPPSASGIPEENLAGFGYWARRWSDALTQPAADLLDGLGYEMWFIDNEGRTARQLWKSNPGMYMFATSNWQEQRSPNYTEAYTCAHGESHLSHRIRGRDDQYGYENPPGARPIACQADCRPLRLTDPGWGDWCRFSQGTWPDWILKQAEDFFRRQIIAGERVDAHTIYWLREPESTLPRALRRYVYAASMDPIRHAAAARLYSTGLGGYFDRMRDAIDCTIFHRHPHPFDTAYIGNNYLRLYRRADRDHGVLMLDPTRTGHFDSDSEARELSANFISASEPLADREELVVQAKIAPERHVPVPQVEEYAAGALPRAFRMLWQIGEWDASSKELAPEGGFDESFSFAIGSPASGFPSVLAPTPRGPRVVNISFSTQSKAATVLMGQLATQAPESVSVRMDGKLIGIMNTKAAPLKGARAYLHTLGPFALSGGPEHILNLEWDGRGSGFALDALALAEGEPGAPVSDPSPREVEIEFGKGAVVPPGLGVALRYPDKLTLVTKLSPGRYALCLTGLKAGCESAVALMIDGEFGPGFGMAKGEKASEKRLEFGVSRVGQHRLELTDLLYSDISWHGIKLIKTSDTSIDLTFPEPAGHLSRMREEVLDPRYCENREYLMISDFPALQIDVERRMKKPSVSRTALSLKGSQAVLNGKALKPGLTRLPAGSSYLVISGAKGLSGIGVSLSGYAADTAIDWRPGSKLDIVSPRAGGAKMRIRIGLIGTLYSAEELRKAMAAAFETEQVDSVEAVVRNTLEVPLVKVVRISKPGPGPYFACEQGCDGKSRWIARGGQASLESPGSDYVKLYLQPKGSTRLAEWGWLEDTAMPAYGCQHIMALWDISGDAKQARARARVMQVAPHVFAPGIRFRHPIASAKVNGREWAYFEEDTVRLPVARGDYDVEVRFEGETVPHLTRTCARVTRAEYSNGELLVRAELPQWVDQMPGDLKFAFAVNGVSARPSPGRDYEISRAVGSKAILWADPGELRIRF